MSETLSGRASGGQARRGPKRKYATPEARSEARRAQVAESMRRYRTRGRNIQTAPQQSMSAEPSGNIITAGKVSDARGYREANEWDSDSDCSSWTSEHSNNSVRFMPAPRDSAAVDGDVDSNVQCIEPFDIFRRGNSNISTTRMAGEQEPNTQTLWSRIGISIVFVVYKYHAH